MNQAIKCIHNRGGRSDDFRLRLILKTSTIYFSSELQKLWYLMSSHCCFQTSYNPIDLRYVSILIQYCCRLDDYADWTNYSTQLFLCRRIVNTVIRARMADEELMLKKLCQQCVLIVQMEKSIGYYKSGYNLDGISKLRTKIAIQSILQARRSRVNKLNVNN